MATLLNCWTFVLVIIGTGEKVHIHSLVKQSARLENGATEEDALRLIGEPKLRWNAGKTLFFGERPAQWIYGTTIELPMIFIPELPFANPIPLKFRLFSPDEEDLVLEWTADKKISKVQRPELNVRDGSEKFLKPVYFLADLAHLFVSKKIPK